MVVYTWILPDESDASQSSSQLLSTMAASKEEALQQVEAGLATIAHDRKEFAQSTLNFIQSNNPTISPVEENIWLLRLASNVTLTTGGSFS